MRIIAYTFLIVLAIGCSNDKEKPRSVESPPMPPAELQLPNPVLPIPEDSVLIASVKENLEGLNNEDLAWAMEPLHSNSPFMQDPAYHIRGSFLVYDMVFTLVDINIEYKTDTACVATVKHDSYNLNENTYEAQRSTQRYTWKPDGKKWKIWKMKVVGSTPLYMLQKDQQ